ncbi:MAG: DUF308 domain-containing protein [Methanospirillaceae archaeon]|nr:DUF308 domain-containing protein [Methanospirillaceae archaeon]
MDTDRLLAGVIALIAIIFGLIAIAVPFLLFELLILIIGIVLLIIGILTAGVALSQESGLNKTLLLCSGLLSIIIGLLALISPYVATIAIAYLIAIWLVINGIIAIAYAVSISYAKHRILTGIWGVVSLLIGLFLFVSPMVGIELLVLIVGIFFIIYGLVSLVMVALYWKQ